MLAELHQCGTTFFGVTTNARFPCEATYASAVAVLPWYIDQIQDNPLLMSTQAMAPQSAHTVSHSIQLTQSHLIAEQTTAIIFNEESDAFQLMR